MDNTKTIVEPKSKPPFSQNRLFELLTIVAMLIVIVGASLFELGLIYVPKWIIQKTGDNTIYQTLFSAQASLVGVVLAILGLMTNVVDSKIYGLSVTQYIMKIRPIVFFRHGWIIIDTIIIVFLTWCFVALNLNNIAIALFFITGVLLVRLALDVLRIMHSSHRIKDEIENYFMLAPNNALITNLFNEINDGLLAGNSVLLQQDVTFAKKLIEERMGEMSDEMVSLLLDLFSTIIHTAYESNSSKAAEILDLYIIAVEVSSDSNKSFSLPSILSMHEVFQLFSKTSADQLYGASGKSLLFRCQVAILRNAVLENKGNSNIGLIASRLYHFAYKNNVDISSKTGIKILHDAQVIQSERFLRSNNVDEGAAKDNYLDLIMTLFREGDSHLLNTLFGFDGSDVGISFKPILSKYNDFEFTKINVFLIIYLFYLTFYEGNTKTGEREFFTDLLNKVAPSFWSGIIKYARKYSENLLEINEVFDYFNQMMYQYEHHGDFSYGFTDVRTLIFEDVVLDFVSFSLAHLPISDEHREKFLSAILDKNNQLNVNPFFTVFNRYVITNRFEDYQRFYTIMRGYAQGKSENEYVKLKDTIISLYKKKQIEMAENDSAEFSNNSNEYEQALSEVFMDASKEVSSQFLAFTDGDKPDYETHSFNFEVFISGGEMPIEAEEVSRYFVKHLNTVIFKEIKNHLELVEIAREDANVSMFMDSLVEEEQYDLHFGYAAFHHNDPDYEKYLVIKEGCKQLDANVFYASAVANSKLIKMDISDARAKIRRYNEKEIDDVIEHGNALDVNGYPIPLEDEIAQAYLKNSKRKIEANLVMAIECTKEVIGGGFLFINNA